MFNRHRSRPSNVKLGPYEFTFWKIAYPSGNTVIQNSGSGNNAVYGAEPLSEEMWDTVTPQFRSIVRNGGIVNTNMSYEKRSFTRTAIDFVCRRPPNIPTWEEAYVEFSGALGALATETSFPPSDYSAIIEEAKTAVLAKINASTFEGLVAAGELRETMRTIRNPLRGIQRLVSRKTGRNVSSSDFVKAAASTWLEGRMAWRPLLSDIQNALEAARKPYSPRLTARAQRTGSNSTSAPLRQTSAGGYPCDVLSTYSSTMKVRVGALYSILDDWKGDFGVRIRDIPSAAWNLIPYSFVVDWFSNVGDFIEASVPNGQVRILAAWTCTHEKVVVVDNVQITSYANGTYPIQSGGAASQTTSVETKGRSAIPLEASLVLKRKNIKSILSGEDLRSFDLISLLSGKGRRARS